MKAYTSNRAKADALALESSPIGLAIQELMERERWISKTATELLGYLNAQNDGNPVRSTSFWPKTARKLGGDLRRIAPNLRAAGISVTFKDPAGHAKRRLIVLRKTN